MNDHCDPFGLAAYGSASVHIVKAWISWAVGKLFALADKSFTL